MILVCFIPHKVDFAILQVSVVHVLISKSLFITQGEDWLCYVQAGLCYVQAGLCYVQAGLCSDGKLPPPPPPPPF